MKSQPNALPTITVKCGCGKTERMVQPHQIAGDIDCQYAAHDVILTRYTLAVKCRHCEQKVITDVLVFEAP